MDMMLIVGYGLGLILLFVILKIFYAPIKLLFKLFLNAIGGGLILLLVNFVGAYLNIQVGLNIFTALIAGILGVPGVLLILLLQIILKV